MATNVWGARELIWQLFRRDFVGAYKKSWLGFAWFFIMPLMGIVSWVFLQKSGMLKPGDVGIPYPAYVLIGTSMYTLFKQLFGVFPSWKAIFLPLVALPLFFFAAGIGLIASMINVVIVDVSRIIDMALTFGMYLTPVIYSDKIANPIVQTVIKWNPLTYLIGSCRDILIYGRLYKPTGYFITAGLSLLVFLFAWRLFFVSEDKLVERMI